MSSDLDTYDEPGHGDSPAAWIGVVLMLIGISAGTYFFLVDQALLVWVSVAFTVLGLVVGVLLAKLGYGVKGPKYAPKKH